MRWIFVAGLLGGLFSCASVRTSGADPTTAPTTRPASRPAILSGASYHRAGGFAGTDDRIEIGGDGSMVVTGKLMGHKVGQLTEDQLAPLIRAAEHWPELADVYTAQKGAADDFVVTIRLGEKSVTASDAADGVPPLFMEVRAMMERAAGQL